MREGKVHLITLGSSSIVAWVSINHVLLNAVYIFISDIAFERDISRVYV